MMMGFFDFSHIEFIDNLASLQSTIKENFIENAIAVIKAQGIEQKEATVLISKFGANGKIDNFSIIEELFNTYPSLNMQYNFLKEFKTHNKVSNQKTNKIISKCLVESMLKSIVSIDSNYDTLMSDLENEYFNIAKTLRNFGEDFPNLENRELFSTDLIIELIFESLKEQNQKVFQAIIITLEKQLIEYYNDIYDTEDDCYSENNSTLKVFFKLMDTYHQEEFMDEIVQSEKLYSNMHILTDQQREIIYKHGIKEENIKDMIQNIKGDIALQHLVIYANLNKAKHLLFDVIEDIEFPYRKKIQEYLNNSDKYISHKNELFSAAEDILQNDFKINNDTLNGSVLDICQVLLDNTRGLKGVIIDGDAKDEYQIKDFILNKKNIILDIISQAASLENDENAQKAIKSRIIKPLRNLILSYENDIFQRSIDSTHKHTKNTIGRE